jgi:hypothetical protein
MTVAVLTTDSLRELRYEILEAITNTLEKKNEKPKKWLSKKELQEIIDISHTSLKKLRDAGIIKFWKDEKFVYYDWEHIEELLEGPHLKGKPKRK